MAVSLVDKIETPGGDIMVLTKAKQLFVFDAPRSSVMPYGAGHFAATPGFMVRYNTSDASVLREWHEMLLALLAQGLFAATCAGTRSGTFPYPEAKMHLQQYVKAFV